MNQEDAVPLSVLLEHLKWHLQRMAEMQKNEPTDYFRDAALQRYEFTLGSVLKCIRAAAGDRASALASDEAVLALAVKESWLPQDTNWQDMLASCRRMQPDTRKQHADAVYGKLPDYRQRFQSLFDNLSSRIQAG